MKGDFVLNQVMNAREFKVQVSLENHFDSVADKILNNVLLKVDDNNYRFTEIEFYFKNNSFHQDPYIHQDTLQRFTGQWYFHGSGLDITFGDGINYGGILIRGLKSLDPTNEEFISGPLMVVKEIFKSFGNMSKKSHQFNIIETLKLEQTEIAKSTRVGLKVKPGDRFSGLFYRYVAFPFESSHKYAEKTKVANALLNHEKQLDGMKDFSTDKINKQFGWKILKV